MKTFKSYRDKSDPTKEKNIEMSMNSVSEEGQDYAAHDYYDSPKKKVLKRKSPSSSGGSADGSE